MRALTLVLVLLIALLQWSLWLGKGSWLRVSQLDEQYVKQKALNEKLTTRNSALEAEVRDLKQGFDAIEERARSELGMIRDDETFFQVLENTLPATPSPTTASRPPQ